jgi:hypothetical protein
MDAKTLKAAETQVVDIYDRLSKTNNRDAAATLTLAIVTLASAQVAPTATSKTP